MKFWFLILLFQCSSLFAQQTLQTFLKRNGYEVSDELLQKTNSVILSDDTNVILHNQKKLEYSKITTTLVLNSMGLEQSSLYAIYNNSNTIKNFEASVLYANQNKIIKFKSSDYKDESYVDSNAIFTDSRVKKLSFVPISYPFIITLKIDYHSTNTAAIPSFYTYTNYNQSILSKSYKVKSNEDLGFRYKVKNDALNQIKISNSDSGLLFHIHNLPALIPEKLSQSFIKIVPYTIFGIDKFCLEGVLGTASNWQEYGDWFESNLLKDLDVLPKAFVLQLQEMVKEAKTVHDKALIIYDYLQKNTRYISIQVGIGGFKPFSAAQTHKLGYGDCKALTNYMKAMLKAVGVVSYYCELYAGDERMNIEKDFTSIQGNHVMLALPQVGGYEFIECTSQYSTMGMNPTFSNDRLLLVIKPGGQSELVHTPQLNSAQNVMEHRHELDINENGSISILTTASYGGVFRTGMEADLTKSPLMLKKKFLEENKMISNPSISKISLQTSAVNNLILEEVQFIAPSLSTKMGTDLFLNLYPFSSLNLDVTIKDKQRKQDIELSNNLQIVDEIFIKYPASFTYKPIYQDVFINTIFGTFKQQFSYPASGIHIKSSMVLNAGIYSKDNIDKLQDFFETVKRLEHNKLIFNL